MKRSLLDKYLTSRGKDYLYYGSGIVFLITFYSLLIKYWIER